MLCYILNYWLATMLNTSPKGKRFVLSNRLVLQQHNDNNITDLQRSVEKQLTYAET